MLCEELTSWAEFRPWVDKIVERHRLMAGGTKRGAESPIIFRGQADSAWELRTSLERWTAGKKISANDYLLHASACYHELESYTGKHWPDVLLTPDEIAGELQRRGGAWALTYRGTATSSTCDTTASPRPCLIGP